MNLLKHQNIPEGNWWDTWFLRGARACGKTYAAINFADKKMRAGLPVIWIGNSGMHNLVIDGLAGRKSDVLYHAGSKTIKHKDGGSVYLFSDRLSPDRLRGPQFGAAVWDDIECAPATAEDIYQYLRFTLRIGEKPQTMITSSNGVPSWLIHYLSTSNVAYTHGTVKDNIPNLAPSFVAAHLSI